MEWVTSITNVDEAKTMAAHLTHYFTRFSIAEWFSILTMIKYTEEECKNEYRKL
tara:strand:+ start:41 stop:202 length:162 start_codon:yes stop_codon:yes gene_type:complete